MHGEGCGGGGEGGEEVWRGLHASTPGGSCCSGQALALLAPTCPVPTGSGPLVQVGVAGCGLRRAWTFAQDPATSESPGRGLGSGLWPPGRGHAPELRGQAKRGSELPNSSSNRHQSCAGQPPPHPKGSGERKGMGMVAVERDGWSVSCPCFCGGCGAQGRAGLRGREHAQRR